MNMGFTRGEYSIAPIPWYRDHKGATKATMSFTCNYYFIFYHTFYPKKKIESHLVEEIPIHDPILSIPKGE